MKCDQLLHGRERYSAANCYMGGRGTVRPTVTWEGEVQCKPTVTSEREVKCDLTVTWEGEVQCDQLLHGREKYRASNCYMGGRGTVTNCYMGGRG